MFGGEGSVFGELFIAGLILWFPLGLVITMGSVVGFCVLFAPIDAALAGLSVKSRGLIGDRSLLHRYQWHGIP